jgi:DNA primase catalytic core
LIDLVKSRSDIVKVASGYMQLDHSNKGLCPLHSEGNPSFQVYPAEQRFHCYGCHKHGDVIDLVMLKENRQFYDVLSDLAQKAGVPLPGVTREMRNLLCERRKIEDILAATMDYYCGCLTSDARSHLENQRGFSEETISRFRIGFAGGGLKEHLRKIEYDEELCLKAGVLTRDGSAVVRDLFLKRLVFPSVRAGRVVHLTARAFDGQEPKYLHLPGAIHFLFNEDALVCGDVLLVEGPTDCISAVQAGYASVAAYGTHLKPEFVDRFSRCRPVFICFDADGAGRQGAVDAADKLGDRARIVQLPEGEDVNDYLKEHPKEDFQELLDSALDLIQYELRMIPVEIDRVELPRRLDPVLKKLAELDRATSEAYLGHEIGERFKLSDQDVEAYRATVADRRRTRDASLKGVTPTYKEETPLSDDVHETDLGNAKRFVLRHGENLRYCLTKGAWLVWDGIRWKPDSTGEVDRLAKATVLSVYGEANGTKDRTKRQALAKHAARSEGEGRIRAMISLAETEPGIPVESNELDADPWLFNCNNGTLDLRTGELRPHRREDLITKLAPVDYDPNAKCPKCDAFLDRIMGGNAKLVRFIQKAVGYALTGDTREQCFFILYGTGANGKSTFIETVRSMLGDYARQTDFRTFTPHRGESPRNDIARLAGARFVSAVEAESGQPLAEALVKQVTGGDTVTARFLYGEFFEFTLVLKFFLAVNHKPRIGGTDNAIWRRVKMIPFDVTIPEEEQDKTLKEKLKQELPGILRWAVEGCLAWQREEGLGDPEEVRRATGAYKEEMDPLAGFIADKCGISGDSEATAGELYEEYSAWCDRNGETPLGKREFGVKLRERGLKADRSKGQRVWVGIGLLSRNEMVDLDDGPEGNDVSHASPDGN